MPCCTAGAAQLTWRLLAPERVFFAGPAGAGRLVLAWCGGSGDWLLCWGRDGGLLRPLLGCECCWLPNPLGGAAEEHPGNRPWLSTLWACWGAWWVVVDVVEGAPHFLFMDLGVRVGCGWETGWWWGHVG